MTTTTTPITKKTSMNDARSLIEDEDYAEAGGATHISAEHIRGIVVGDEITVHVLNPVALHFREKVYSRSKVPGYDPNERRPSYEFRANVTRAARQTFAERFATGNVSRSDYVHAIDIEALETHGAHYKGYKYQLYGCLDSFWHVTCTEQWGDDWKSRNDWRVADSDDPEVEFGEGEFALYDS